MKQRMKVSILTAVLLMAFEGFGITISEIVNEASITSYSNHLDSLYVSDGNSRAFTHTGSTRQPAFEHDLARDYIFNTFQSMGYDTWLDPFTFTFRRNSPSTSTYIGANNVVAIKQGYPGTNVYVIGGHYDSVDPETAPVTICPGADDNASGIAGLLEVASLIKDYTFRDTIIIIAFDAEEKDYKGSTHFVNTHTTVNAAETNATTFLRSSIKGMFCADMIAYHDDVNPNDVGIHIFEDVSNHPVQLALAQAVTNYTYLNPVLDHFDWSGQSDHQSFHKKGIDAAMFIEQDTIDNPNFHEDSDSVDTPGYIKYPYAIEMTKAMAGYLCEQARVIPPATIDSQLGPTNTFNLSWTGTPGVAYNLYGTDALSTSNAWNFIQYVAPTNAEVLIEVQLDVSSATQGMFKVLSE